jgi:hypothetical protein
VLGSRILNWILGNIYSTGIVTVNDHHVLIEARITKQFLHPQLLGTTTFNSNILSICSGKGN